LSKQLDFDVMKMIGVTNVISLISYLE